MPENIGHQIDNSEIIRNPESLQDKNLKKSILNKLSTNGNFSDYKKNYDYFKSLDSEKINILNNLSNNEFKVIQELLMTEGNNNEKIFSNLQKLKEINRLGDILEINYFKQLINVLKTAGNNIKSSDIDTFIYKNFKNSGLFMLHRKGIDEPIKLIKDNIKGKYLNNLKNLLGNDVLTNYSIINKDTGRLNMGFQLYGEAFLFEKNTERYLNEMNERYKDAKVKMPTLKEYQNITIINELIHLNLEKKFNFESNNFLEKGLENIDPGVNIKLTNKLIHEFLSDVGSMTVSGKDAITRISNVLRDTKLIIKNGKIDFIGEPINIKGYKYSYKFILKLLNNISKTNKNIDFNSLKRGDEIEKYIINNLTEEDFNYIQTEYIKQGKIWIDAIKKLN